MPSGSLIGIRSTILFSADSQIRIDRWKMTIFHAKGFPKLNDKVQPFGIESCMEMNFPL
jgi:predicted amidohydrolase